MPDPAAVCFDMDGVVVDSERYWVPIENERILPRAVAGEAPSAEEVTGMNVEDIYEYLDRTYGTRLERAEFLALYDDAAEELYTERVDLMEGFRELVATLGDRGASVALVSSSSRRWIGYVTERFDLVFDAVVSAEDLEGPSKPDPEIYLAAARRLGVDPEDCVAVEDSAHGVAAATGAGMDCLGYGVNDGQDLSGATAVVRNPAELRERLTADRE